MSLSKEEAISKFSEFDSDKQMQIEAKSVGSPDVISAVMGRFLQYGADQGWYFDEDLSWHQVEGEVPRSVADMVAQFEDLVFVKQDGETARVLRDKFLTFVEGKEHAPLIEGLYEKGWVIEEDGALVPPSA